MLSIAWQEGCALEPGAILILAPDPKINSEIEILEQIKTIEILLDAEGGFQGVSQNQIASDDFTATDFDQDDQIELFATIQISNSNHLPRIRLDPGSNLDTNISIKVHGVGEVGQVVAFGGIEPQRLFSDSEKSYVNIPFNLSIAHRAPVVVAVSPVSIPAGVTLASIGFYVSKSLDPNSLTDRVKLFQLVGEMGAEQELVIPGSLNLIRSCAFDLEMWSFAPNQCLILATDTARFRLQIDAGVKDKLGKSMSAQYSHLFQWSQLRGLGPCTPDTTCQPTGTTNYRSDLICNSTSGRMEPASCTASPTSCEHEWYSFGWLSATSENQCTQIRNDSFYLGGDCLISNPWSCNINQDCTEFGSKRCDQQTQLCIPESCQTSCLDPSLACAADQGCLPRMGVCVPDCMVLGGCPDFSQQCMENNTGGSACQGIQ